MLTFAGPSVPLTVVIVANDLNDLTNEAGTRSKADAVTCGIR